jgi:hypothetical protein
MRNHASRQTANLYSAAVTVGTAIRLQIIMVPLIAVFLPQRHISEKRNA